MSNGNSPGQRTLDKVTDVLSGLLGARTVEEVRRFVRKLPIPSYRFLLVVPAPRITSPAPGASVPAGASLTVTVTTNAPDMPHEVLLLDGADPSIVLDRDSLAPPPPIPSPQDYHVTIPPGAPASYYLEVGIVAGSAGEQQRYRILITTTPMAPAMATTGVLADHPPGTYPSSPEIVFAVGVNGGTPPYSYAWDFGDGNTSDLASPTHTYAGPGTYTVSVTATDIAGQSVTASGGTYTISGGPPLAMTGVLSSPSPGSHPTGTAFVFAAGVNGGSPPYTHAWDFGDGNTSSAQSPSHTYTAAGSYTVTVTVTDSAGGSVAGNAGPFDIT